MLPQYPLPSDDAYPQVMDDAQSDMMRNGITGCELC